MNYLLKILCLFYCPKKLLRGEAKAIYTMDVMLFVALTEALVGSAILTTTIFSGTKNIFPVLFVLTFAISYALSFILASILYLSNLVVIKRLTFRECLKVVMPARMANAPYMISNTCLRVWGLELFGLLTTAIMLLHATSLLVLYLRKLYYCRRRDIAILIVLYCAGVFGVIIGVS